MSRGASSIDYLLFADDSVIFYKANVDRTRKVQSLLVEYEVASRQCINLEKMVVVLFSKNTLSHTRTEVMALWTNGILQQYERYLGLPPIIGRDKRKAFSKIKDSVWNQLNIWKEKTLSRRRYHKEVKRSLSKLLLCPTQPTV